MKLDSMKLYTYFRSSAAYRVRIALNLKGLDYQAVPVHLLNNGGEQRQADYLAINPAGLLPALDVDGAVLTQSLAIIEYLEEVYPQVALLPTAPLSRARVRSLAQAIACDIHPLGNLRVLKYLKDVLQLDEAAKLAWLRHWIGEGLATLESQLAASPDTGLFTHGDTPGMADCCLVPQVFNARRFGIDLDAYPAVARIDTACASLPAFIAAHPSQQPDAE
jgi:maleylpyruvate isomerase